MDFLVKAYFWASDKFASPYCSLAIFMICIKIANLYEIRKLIWFLFRSEIRLLFQAYQQGAMPFRFSKAVLSHFSQMNEPEKVSKTFKTFP